MENVIHNLTKADITYTGFKYNNNNVQDTHTYRHMHVCMHHAHTQSRMRAHTHKHAHTHMDSQLLDKHTVSNFLCYYDCNYNNNMHLECTLLNDALRSMKDANLNIYHIMHSKSLRHYLHTHIRR